MLADAGALLALSSTANAGITIPAGDWTLDVSGNVNAYTSVTSVDKAGSVTGSVHHAADDSSTRRGIGTGLLPAWIGFTGKSRQNDLDIEFGISFQTGASSNSVHGDGSVAAEQSQVLNRQTYVKFGDASWGSIKLGKDLGIYGSQAILNDMTLLGVGAFHALGNGISGSQINTTTGGIGSGYQYAAWRGQATYQSPNWNGFQATIGLMNPNQVGAGLGDDTAVNQIPQSRFGVEGQLQYAWAGDVSGKVWTSFGSYKVTRVAGGDSISINAYDLGANVNVAGFGLTGYAYNGSGNGTATLGYFGIDANGKKRDGKGGYVQATYVIPAGTKLGVAYGVSKVDDPSNAAAFMDQDSRITVGAYHPLTKSLNLVAEYNRQKVEANGSAESKYDTYSLGAILFF